MEIKGVYRYSDLLAALWIHHRPRRLYALLGVALLAVWVLVMLDALMDASGRSHQNGWILLGLLTFMAAYAFLYVPYHVRREFRQAAHAESEVQIQAGPDGMDICFINGHITVAWSDCRKWKEGGPLFLLYATDSSYLTLPKRFFRERSDVDWFRSTLVQRVASRENARR